MTRRGNAGTGADEVEQVLACKELNYGRMDERDLRQLTEEVYVLVPYFEHVRC